MGRNKKGKPAPLQLEEPREDEELRDESSTHSDGELNGEEPVVKKKVYHGNKLNRGAAGKVKKQGDSPLLSLSPSGVPPVLPLSAGVHMDTLADGEIDAVGDDSDTREVAEKLTKECAVARNEPVEVLYCPICTFPAEMCEFSGMYEQCRPWLLEHAKELAEAEERGRKRRALTERERLERLVQGRGTKKAIERAVLVEVTQRKGRKMITSVRGMDLFGHNLKDLSREWKKLFSCGAGLTTSEELKQSAIDIQGNVAAQLIELLPERYNIPKEAIYQMEDKKKVQCYASS